VLNEDHLDGVGLFWEVLVLCNMSKPTKKTINKKKTNTKNKNGSAVLKAESRIAKIERVLLGAPMPRAQRRQSSRQSSQSLRGEAGWNNGSRSRNARFNFVNREFFGNVITDGTGNFIFPIISAINPGFQSIFPWLSDQAPSYEKYRFKKLNFVFESNIGNSNSSAQQIGDVSLGFVYDPSQTINTQNEDWVRDYVGVVTEKTSQKRITLVVDPKSLSGSTDNNRYVLFAPPAYNVNGSSVTTLYNIPTQRTLTEYVPGQFFVAIQGQLGYNAGSTIGKMYVEYDVEFRGTIDVTPNSVLSTHIAGTGLLTTAIGTTSTFNNVLLETGSLLTSIVSVGMAINNGVKFGSGQQGRYLMLFNYNFTNTNSAVTDAIQFANPPLVWVTGGGTGPSGIINFWNSYPGVVQQVGVDAIPLRAFSILAGASLSAALVCVVDVPSGGGTIAVNGLYDSPGTSTMNVDFLAARVESGLTETEELSVIENQMSELTRKIERIKVVRDTADNRRSSELQRKSRLLNSTSTFRLCCPDCTEPRWSLDHCDDLGNCLDYYKVGKVSTSDVATVLFASASDSEEEFKEVTGEYHANVKAPTLSDSVILKINEVIRSSSIKK